MFSEPKKHGDLSQVDEQVITKGGRSASWGHHSDQGEEGRREKQFRVKSSESPEQILAGMKGKAENVLRQFEDAEV